VAEQIAVQLPNNPLHERLETSLGGSQSAIVLVDDLEQGLVVVDGYAPEHLEILTRNAPGVARRVHNAGAIFVGGYSPVPLGDYAAGSTHVLPTAGAARFSSGLTCRSFTRAVHFIEYDEEGLADIGPKVEVFADAESLPGHRDAIRIREVTR
jgi:histidinol dehydrogenase